LNLIPAMSSGQWSYRAQLKNPEMFFQDFLPRSRHSFDNSQLVSQGY
jgi:hypothetical protein